jgi:hypothetical protein
MSAYQLDDGVLKREERGRGNQRGRGEEGERKGREG